jgi:hypothetical protein
MRTQDFIVAIVAIVALTFILMSSLGSEGDVRVDVPVLKQPVYERWAVIETTVKSGESTTTVRRYMVGPDGTWYVIPTYHQEWANSLVEGQEVKMPGSIDAWRTHGNPYFPDFDPLEGESTLKGGVSQEGNKAISSLYTGIYFFGS